MKTPAKRLAINTTMLSIFHIAKIIFPFITLPYLTRILSTDTYGVVTYVKTVMAYLQVLVDFGFVLSATKDIVKIRHDHSRIGLIVGDTLIARVILGFIGLFATILLAFILPILRQNFLFTVLSYLVVFASIFLLDFLFRGIERMHIITIRFIITKTLSTILTFLLIKNDSDLLLIPILDLISTFIAILWVLHEVKKMQLRIRYSNLKNAFKSIKTSFVYFLSDVASTSFNAFSTIIVGLFLTTTDVAYWGICMQIIGTIQACYSPLSGGIYPEMIRTRSLKLIHQILKIFLPLITLGCILFVLCAKFGLFLLGGGHYVAAAPILQILTPCLFFSFLAIIYGWPTLGAIDQNRAVTISTVTSVIINIALLLLLALTDHFTLINIAIIRVLSEIILFGLRFAAYFRHKQLFSNS